VEFFGAYQHRIDAKGRVALPAVFRDGFGEERVCYIAAETSQRCLTVYPADEFKLMVGRLQEAKREGRFTQRQLTNFMAAVSQSSIDAQGRINLPEHLRDFASIDKDATLIGAANHIAVFPAETHSPEAALDDLIDVSDLL
jgi:MraZ protein